jgi:hypothetical protein
VDKEILSECLDRTVRMEDFTKAKFSRVKNNIISSLNFLKTSTRISVWKELVGSELNELIITDCFWLVVLKKNAEMYESNVRPAPKSRGIEVIDETKLSDQETQKDLSRVLKFKTSFRNLQQVADEGMKRTEIFSPSKTRLPYTEDYYQVEDAILNRVAINYHDMFETYTGPECQLFFQVALI